MSFHIERLQLEYCEICDGIVQVIYEDNDVQQDNWIDFGIAPDMRCLCGMIDDMIAGVE